MKVLVTGHDGYVGSVLVPLLLEAGHTVTGLDSFLFEECVFAPSRAAVPARRIDLRDVRADDLRGFEAVVHLGALSNDPLGDLDPAITYAVNHTSSVRLAEEARTAGVRRFVFASSCSLYGAAAGDVALDEAAAFNPVTPYGESKVLVEQDVAKLASDRFSPVFMRNATAYGVSPRLRLDIVVNDLVGCAVATGQVLIRSDGMAWRPLVHVEDIGRAVVAALDAPRERIHNQAFNVGTDAQNFRIREVADLVEQLVRDCRVVYEPGAGADKRSYRVDFGKIRRQLPEFQPRWSLADGIGDLERAYRAHGLTQDELKGGRYIRLRHLQRLKARGAIDDLLRRMPAPAPA